MKYIEPTPAIDGWMSIGELEWLYEKACEMDSIAEIGCWMGKSTHALLSGCKGLVYAIDHFKGSISEINEAHLRAKTDDIHAIFKTNVGHFLSLITLKMDSREASKLFKDKEIDMIFIDGDHDEARIDIEAWLPKCGKLLCGHDMTQQGVPKALEELKIRGMNIVQVPFTSIWSLEI